MTVRRTQQVARLGTPIPGTAGQMLDVDPAGDTLESVTPTGTGSPVKAVSPALTGTATAVNLTASGTAAIGTTRVGNVSLRVLSSALTGGVQAGVVINPTFTTSASTAGETLEVTFATAAGSFTMANGYAIRILAPTIGAGSTVTNLYALKIEDMGASGISIQTGTGKQVWGGDVSYATTSKALTPYPLAMETMVDADKVLAIGTCSVSTSTAFTAPRTVTIPNLVGLPPRIITVADTGGAVTALNTLSISVTQPINGGIGTNIIAHAYGCIVFFWNGTAFTLVSVI